MFTNATSVVIGGKEVQSIKITSNNAILYEKPSSQGSNVSSVSLTSDNQIISYYHTGSVILSATVLDNNSSPLANKTVEFFKGGTSIGTSTTDANGVATKSYSSTGVGDVSFNAECDNISSTPITVEDCIFFDATETSKKTGSSMIKGNVYDNLSLTNLPQHFVWSIDMKVSSLSSSEDRIFLTPTAHNGEQPPYGLWVQLASSSNGAGYGVRRNGGSYASGSKLSYSANTYVHFEIDRNGDTITGSANNSNLGTMTETWIDDYNSWWFSYSFWKRSNITGTWKNLKIKAL